MKQILTLFSVVFFLVGCSGTVRISVPDTAGKRLSYAREHLQQALQEHADQVPSGQWTITLREGAEGPKEGFSISRSGNEICITGNDGTGVIYGVQDFIEHSLLNADRNSQYWMLDSVVADAPEMVLRGTCIGQQKPYLLPGRMVYEYPLTPELFPWFYDKQQWIEYLDMLVANRMNSLYLWNGHPFASLVRLDDYPFAVEVDSATFALNEELYGFLTEEADKRGIFVIQMFYNILVSKPFAEHYGIKTQDRHRPITPLIADYTRKSITAFVEKYPNVGLLVCLGEAMDTYEDDAEWFCKTIIPGVRDGLDSLARRDPKYSGYEPPILLRAHDTDCKMVMEQALPLYRNLYTMHKYNGESLTTYQPRGPWSEIHQGLAALGSTHIENVHILANLEPWRWSSPLFVRRTVKAMHDVHHANALHLYPQASYWDYPFTADKLSDGERLKQLDRDWLWYRTWARYAWKHDRDSVAEDRYWDQELAAHWNTSEAVARQLRTAYDESGEIAPKLLRRFGITEGNRQTLLLGMFCAQLVNPYKYTIYPGFYESCGPEGEKLIEWAEKEWKGEPQAGELPLDIVDQCVEHADKAVAAIDAVNPKDIGPSMRSEFMRLRNDIYCYRAFANAFRLKVQAARKVLDYQWTHDLRYLDEVAPLLEQSLDWWQQLVGLTQDTYLYANSMQTAQRRIPVGGDGGKNIHWAEMLPLYQQELANFRHHLQTLKAAGSEQTETAPVKSLQPAEVRLIGNYRKGSYRSDAALVTNKPEATLTAVADELRQLTPLCFDGDKQRNEGTRIEFEAKQPVKLLVGYFRDDQKRYAAAPKLETDASANDYGQAEPVLEAAIHLKGMPLANVHAYHFEAGHHTLLLPKGYLLVLGFTSDDIPFRNVGLAGNADALDWLFY
ncbi:MAG: hypothetical protein J6U31_07935 [Bacteroidales bacterium]|nr:hypothetical protein [Bacteroidales bacterium]